MCVGCGGTCADGARGPRYASHAGGPNLRVVGTNNGPTAVPDRVIRQTNGLITYENLYTGLGPDGRPAILIAPGTFGSYATRAGKGR